jgi:predicted ATPase/DNA-binding winged helix-turn-helix (wHTH) protein
VLARADETYIFGSFQLVPAQRLLLNTGRSLPLGSRALEILITLIECAGATVSKDQLIGRVWPDTVVDEGALRVHVAAVRKALGDGREGNRFIINNPGQGYSFVAPVTRVRSQEAPAPLHQPARSGNLPALLTRVVGRDEIIATVVSRCSQHRLVTMVGPGGIGKTTVAIAAAETMSESFADGIWFVGLATLVDAALVPAAVGAALDMPSTGVDPLTALAAWSRDKHMLIVLDSCEHVAGAAAAVAEVVLRTAPRVCILATSREALLAESEWLMRLPSLRVPSGPAHLSAAQALSYSAVQLFNERAAAVIDGFVLSDADVPGVLEICHALDGVPLALELAAVQVDALGIQGLAQGLTNRFDLLTRGRRTALPRQQTLRATMDWSHDLLLEVEKVVLRRLAVFRGHFTMESATSVVGDEDIRSLKVIEIVANLATKSLVATDISSDITYHYLLDTTRAYALEKLNHSGEATAISRRHADYYRNLLAAVNQNDRAADEFACCAREIDDIRAALTWAFSPEGDVSAGVQLAAASTSVWLGLSLLTECLSWTRNALAALEAPIIGTRWEMVLQCAFGYSLMFTEGLSNTAHAALQRANELAECLQDVDYQLRALAGLASCCHRLQNFQAALDLGRRAETIANRSEDPAVLATADWILGTSLFFLGEYREASTYAQRTRQRTSAPAVRRAHIAKLGRDSFVSASCTVAQAHWAQGLVDQSARLARDLLVETQRGDHPLSLCLVLTWCGCQISLWLGDLETAGRSIAQLKDHAERYTLSGYYAYGSGFEGQLFAKRGNLALAERQLRSCLESLRQGRSETLYTAFLTDLAEVLAKAGRFGESLAAAAEALQRTERSDAFWWMPEALRIKGEILAQLNPSDLSTIEDCFTRSLTCARRQGALSWQLRAATSLARLWKQCGRPADAKALLRPIYARFTEGFETADLRAARTLLEGSA